MRKILTFLTVSAAAVLTLTGCSQMSGYDSENPASGHWTTVSVNDKPVGDVWCQRASSYSAETFDCQWATLTAPGTHANAMQANGEYHFVTATDNSEHKVLCINYRMRKGYHVINCNWEGVSR